MLQVESECERNSAKYLRKVAESEIRYTLIYLRED